MTDWTATDRQLIEEAFARRLADHLGPAERVIVHGETGPTQVRAQVVLEGGARGDRVELEAKVDLLAAELPPDEARDLALDAIDLILLEYLESERGVRFKGVFEPRELRGRQLMVRAERTFPSLEAQADALLKGDADP